MIKKPSQKKDVESLELWLNEMVKSIKENHNNSNSETILENLHIIYSVAM